jgi:hypothetical protein
LSLFRRLLSRWPSLKQGIAVWGWWQGKNLGDNWIKSCMSKAFEGADFIDTSDPNLDRYKFVICGGGGLFIRDVHPIWRRRPSTSYGILGIGAEFAHSGNIAVKLAKDAEFFFVRDSYSVECMGVPPDSRSYDVTFSDPLHPSKGINESRALFVWRDPSELLEFSDFRRYIGAVVSKEDWNRELLERFTSVEYGVFETTEMNIDKCTEDIGFVVSARYHGIVAAIQRGIPCIGIDLCPKIRALMSECGIEEFCLKCANLDELTGLVDKAQAQRNSIRKRQLAFTSRAHDAVVRDMEFAAGRISRCLQVHK